VDELCRKYNKTPAQVAINWLISQPNVVTIAKSSHIEHLQENLGSVGWNMDEQDIELLRHDYPGQQEMSDTVPLS
jgi:diketogulonate reductase-like aldo/keto reductase